MGSGFRATRTRADSPASGVRSAVLEPQAKAVLATPWSPLESDGGLTQVGAPDASLLALARGEKKAERMPPRRAVWFLFGVVIGATGVWGATGNVASDVYRTRMWAAHALRSARGHATDIVSPAAPKSDAAALAPVPIPTVDVSELPRVKEEAQQGQATTAGAPPAPGAPALQHAPGPR
jgi:hypothetical protein